MQVASRSGHSRNDFADNDDDDNQTLLSITMTITRYRNRIQFAPFKSSSTPLCNHFLPLSPSASTNVYHLLTSFIYHKMAATGKK